MPPPSSSSSTTSSEARISTTHAIIERNDALFWKNKEKFTVAVLGAAGGIGQTLSLLLKQSPRIKALRLYDIAPITPGVAVDLSHINTESEVTGYAGPDQLRDALVGCDLVIIPAGIPRKASLNWSGPAYPVTSDSVLMCDKSTATPGVIGAISYNRKAFIRGDCFNSNESVCPIPPAAPKTATVNFSLFFQNRASLRSMMACVVDILASDDVVDDDEDGGGICDSLARTS
jgi:hypothetical protein